MTELRRRLGRRDTGGSTAGVGTHATACVSCDGLFSCDGMRGKWPDAAGETPRRLRREQRELVRCALRLRLGVDSHLRRVGGEV